MQFVFGNVFRVWVSDRYGCGVAEILSEGKYVMDVHYDPSTKPKLGDDVIVKKMFKQGVWEWWIVKSQGVDWKAEGF